MKFHSTLNVTLQMPTRKISEFLVSFQAILGEMTMNSEEYDDGIRCSVGFLMKTLINENQGNSSWMSLSITLRNATAMRSLVE